ncbi:Tripartite tricarboxylate transporter TctB family protein [Aquimixticola soesokkakensis]|uniref:Tripartite tricarboxylate transporter TctB family protein n=1 Tax=Aquimixticola soesokkakensis TaxID=1519096 RepID=A0A1Y5RZ95_9RHOB|nr:tripartite tricarboxylate transporter TctB family protein [Aquimixticola soesokkakensis]SLN27930.1 Tripartite tricarboxylate transporter TctB family protein [Aquimixticola soesokkakensis]
MSNLQRQSPRDLEAARAPRAWLGALGGVGLLALSLVFIWGGIGLGLGAPRRLGTGAFPVITGCALAALSVAIIVIDLRDTSAAERPDWMSFAAIGAALAAFAIVADWFGLIPAVFATTVVASLPDPTLPILGKLILGLVVSLGCWGLFIGLLDLPLQAFKGF